MSEKRRTDIFVHTSKESNLELGERLGLTGEALQNFKYACYEVKLSVDVDMETGDVEIVAVDDAVVLPEGLSANITIEKSDRKRSQLMEDEAES